jgi:organic hydroperoxide reductase OsmC/OhrA
MDRKHNYNLTIKWTGNKGMGTRNYQAYERSHSIVKEGKNNILASSDPAFRGDRSKHNPEELLLASISSCHMLWYLHLCSEGGVIVVDYIDNAAGVMTETADGGGRFSEVTLHPLVTVAEASMISKANELHSKANAMCFIANSLNFKVGHVPQCMAAQND